MKKLVASLVLATLVLAGCANSPSSSSAPPGDALPALLDAMHKTAAAGSSRMAIALSLTAPEQSLHVTGDVAYVLDPADPTSLRERVLLDIPSMGVFPGGEVELSHRDAGTAHPDVAVRDLRNGWARVSEPSLETGGAAGNPLGDGLIHALHHHAPEVLVLAHLEPRGPFEADRRTASPQTAIAREYGASSPSLRSVQVLPRSALTASPRAHAARTNPSAVVT